jgi:hypothetical protein
MDIISGFTEFCSTFLKFWLQKKTTEQMSYNNRILKYHLSCRIWGFHNGGYE